MEQGEGGGRGTCSGYAEAHHISNFSIRMEARDVKAEIPGYIGWGNLQLEMNAVTPSLLELTCRFAEIAQQGTAAGYYKGVALPVCLLGKRPRAVTGPPEGSTLANSADS